ncbi:4-hydroxy-3-methylbut-2-enyl diphosphate reductase [Rubrobacter indicoceani]|uniref:4-hydroxy-3-methylbut-2-enyl diphosphate reductase n=1 Tax=Rubrobacter indicoceani TaxID=2051957 RepID=UPI000E5A9FA0|nr:4-hydroxy-3-methylbut-2-enyl diphosphate reductase [Rubrobacter indicoceani]
MKQENYYRRGFKMRGDIQHLLDRDYRSEIVDRFRENGNYGEFGEVSIRIADEFGFCYGVDRAVDYAFQTRERFPDRDIYITGDMIHNLSMNDRLREMGIKFLSEGFDGRPDEKFSDLGPEDVIILPAFGAPIEWVTELRNKGCIVVDTTCGSVLSVWKRVKDYARRDFTSIIHGKYYHEETKATASQTNIDGGNGKWLVVRNLTETAFVTDFIRQKIDATELRERLSHGMGPDFDPDTDLRRVGVANQTTMLMKETMAVGEELRKAMVDRYGEDEIADHFDLFDTICSATQDRQDALFGLLEHDLDVMVIIGGYNSSNTNNLAIIAKERVPRSYHITNGECIRGDVIDHKPPGTPLDAREEIEEPGWLPDGPVRVGLTAGASTPNSQIGLAIKNILEARDISIDEVLQLPTT